MPTTGVAKPATNAINELNPVVAVREAPKESSSGILNTENV
jgi:hypothetical protein